MKALTLTQPWASLVAVGAKRLETRSWPTKYRGPLAIHAAKGFNEGDLGYLLACWPYHEALLPIGGTMGNDAIKRLPFGAIVATCQLTDCRRTEDLTVGELDARRWNKNEHNAWTERLFGNYAPGRYAFTLEAVTIVEPFPVRGMLGLWDISEDVTFRPVR